MDNKTVLTGIVLSERGVGEYDKLVTILTLERGKIRAFARGAKRPRNHLSAALQPFHFGNFQVYEGRDSYTVESAEILQHFETLRSDLDRSFAGMLLLELSDYYGRENDDNRALLGLLYQSLKALDKGRPEPRLVRTVFEIRALAIDGQYPGIPEGSWEESTRYAMGFIVDTPVERLYTFTVSDSVLEELERIASNFRRRFIDRELKSLSFL
ncbi:MAG: DNA repair protein RecO [Lachnospiraceae bacterium]|jgi:DNA repair protein RecO (recombination protein O)|nr:DNA repair protein RecO [Lachnospiraceae bacterium]